MKPVFYFFNFFIFDFNLSIILGLFFLSNRLLILVSSSSFCIFNLLSSFCSSVKSSVVAVLYHLSHLDL